MLCHRASVCRAVSGDPQPNDHICRMMFAGDFYLVFCELVAHVLFPFLS
jgi:hypothetical protein